MKIEKIKPIPKYIQRLIKKRDMEDCKEQNGIRRFYSYLTKNDGELVKVTVAVKNRYGKWHCKQVAVHGVDSDFSFAKDINFFYIGGYTVGWWEEGFYKNCKWWEGDGWCKYHDSDLDPYAPVVNLEYALKIDKYKYSAIDKYTYMDVIQYLRLYEKYPQMEYLTKLGLSCIATRKQVLELSLKDKKFRKWLAINAEKIANHRYYVYTIMTAYKKSLDFDEVQSWEETKKALQRKDNFKEIKEDFKEDLDKLKLYISKQKTSLSNYVDYMKACKYLHLDFTDTKHRFPMDFKRWHDIRTDEYRSKRAEIDEEIRKDLYGKFAKVAQKYSVLEHFRDKGYVVIIAKSPAELINEGEKLAHCVGRMGYDQKFAREESLIFFVRDIHEQEKPFVTVEYSLETKQILQCYGLHSLPPARKVSDFVYDKWLPYANRQINSLVA